MANHVSSQLQDHGFKASASESDQVLNCANAILMEEVEPLGGDNPPAETTLK